MLSGGALFASWRNNLIFPNAEDEIQQVTPIVYILPKLINSFFFQLRNELGKYLEGSRPDMPYLVQPQVFPHANLNFDFVADPGTNVPFK